MDQYKTINKVRSILLILIMFSGCISLLSYEQGTYFFCLAHKGDLAPAGRILVDANLFKEKTKEEVNKQKIAVKDKANLDEHSGSIKSLDLGALAETHKNKKVVFFDTSKLFKEDPSKSKTGLKEDQKLNSYVP